MWCVLFGFKPIELRHNPPYIWRINLALAFCTTAQHVERTWSLTCSASQSYDWSMIVWRRGLENSHSFLIENNLMMITALCDRWYALWVGMHYLCAVKRSMSWTPITRPVHGILSLRCDILTSLCMMGQETISLFLSSMPVDVREVNTPAAY